MKLYVCLKAVPDTVEELELGEDGKSLDTEYLRFKLGDGDEHALEQALLLKDRLGGTLTVVALEAPEVDDVLFSALAKGADRVAQLPGDFGQLPSVAAARLFHEFLKADAGGLTDDTLILLRSQAMDDLEGEIGPNLAQLLGIPYIGGATEISCEGPALTLVKELSGGLRGKLRSKLPAVVGIQSAEEPPRYVPFAKVRNVKQTASIESPEVAAETAAAVPISRLNQPEAATRATMLEGGADDVAKRIVEILAENGLLAG